MTLLTTSELDARIITLWQPWASAVALGLKLNETRSWATNYRGPLVIHAAKRPCHPAEMQLLKIAMAHINKEAEWRYLVSELESSDRFGAIVALTHLEGCYRMRTTQPINEQEVLIKTLPPLEKALGLWESGRFAWKLEETWALTPVPFKGSQGIRNFRVPEGWEIRTDIRRF